MLSAFFREDLPSKSESIPFQIMYCMDMPWYVHNLGTVVNCIDLFQEKLMIAQVMRLSWAKRTCDLDIKRGVRVGESDHSKLEKGSIWVDFFEVESIFHSCGGQGVYRSYEKWSTLDVGCGFYLHHTQKLDKLMESHAREMLSAVFQCNCLCPPVYPGNAKSTILAFEWENHRQLADFPLPFLLFEGIHSDGLPPYQR